MPKTLPNFLGRVSGEVDLVPDASSFFRSAEGRALDWPKGDGDGGRVTQQRAVSFSDGNRQNLGPVSIRVLENRCKHRV